MGLLDQIFGCVCTRVFLSDRAQRAMWGTRQNFWVLIMKNEFFLGFLIMKNEFIELVFLWTRFPCGAWLTKSCLIKNLAACGFAWSDIWLRLHLCFHTWKTSSINSLYDQANHGNFVRIKHHRENEFNELVFHTWKTSSMNSFSIHGNRVHRTWFLYMETKFFEFDFYVFSITVLSKLSQLNLNCYKQN